MIFPHPSQLKDRKRKVERVQIIVHRLASDVFLSGMAEFLLMER
jgi:hypothetical protein